MTNILDTARMFYRIAQREADELNISWISFLNCPIDLIDLTFSGIEFHSRAPL